MFFPSCVLLWHGLAVVLEPIAAERWRSATARAAEHGIDVNLPRAQVPLVPSTANFLAHPFFQLFFGEGGGERDRIMGLSEVIRPYLPRSSDAGDSGKVADLLGALEEARQSLLIQVRLADGFLAAPYLVHAIIGNSLRSWILDQIRAGIAHQLWEPADLDWIGGWLRRSDGINELDSVPDDK